MATETNNPTPPRPPAMYRAMAVVMHPLERLLGLGCRSFTRLASVRLDRGLTFRERLVFCVHWLVCSICRRQASHNRCLHELLRRGGQDQKLCDGGALSAEAKAKLREKISGELAGNAR